MERGMQTGGVDGGRSGERHADRGKRLEGDTQRESGRKELVEGWGVGYMQGGKGEETCMQKGVGWWGGGGGGRRKECLVILLLG